MSITLIDIYNSVAGQAWSMFDGELESDDEFESSLLSSIQKALTELWCLYPYPFRYKTHFVVTEAGISSYEMPCGNIIKKYVQNIQRHCVKFSDDNYLEFLDDSKSLDKTQGKPKYFYIKNDKIYFHPVPDKEYEIEIEYLTLAVGKNENGEEIFILKKGSDYLDLPQKYESLFLNALITKSMVYAIASQGDENYSGYESQFNEAYRNLLQYCKGIDVDSKIGW